MYILYSLIQQKNTLTYYIIVRFYTIFLIYFIFDSFFNKKITYIYIFFTLSIINAKNNLNKIRLRHVIES